GTGCRGQTSSTAARGDAMSERDKDLPKEPAGVSRRTFVTTAAMAGAGITIVPRHVLGKGFQAPSDTVNVAIAGIGGMGGSNTRNLMSQNIVAVCDVDYGLYEAKLKSYQADLERLQTAKPQAATNTRHDPPSKHQLRTN